MDCKELTNASNDETAWCHNKKINYTPPDDLGAHVNKAECFFQAGDKPGLGYDATTLNR